MELTRLRGFQDLMGPQVRAISFIEERARALMERYAVREIRIPTLERIELYMRSTGATSDIVEKQMYTVERRGEGGDEGQMVLRPEGTPGVVRAYIEAGLDRSDPEQRFFYCGPMLRYERPQKGRYREFYQFGVEVFGRADAACDAELLIMIDDLRRELGLALKMELNSLGCANCRPGFRDAVLAYGRAHFAELCEDCHARLERNPLRLLDCKTDVKIAEGAPNSLDYLCADCRKHFDTVRDLLARAGVEFIVNPRIVRGLDYYMRTTFEVSSTALGAQNAVLAGGRYDGLIAELGGAPMPGIGFAIGLDRMALALIESSRKFEAAPQVAMIALGEAATARAVELARSMRVEHKLAVEMLSPERGLKALLRRADRIGARYAVIIGDNELARGVAQVRDLAHSQQSEVKLDDLPSVMAASAGNR
ncbi:MAG: histidine--tRNA ligase [Candidatus Binataceae bacterium]